MKKKIKPGRNTSQGQVILSIFVFLMCFFLNKLNFLVYILLTITYKNKTMEDKWQWIKEGT